MGRASVVDSVPPRATPAQIEFPAVFTTLTRTVSVTLRFVCTTIILGLGGSPGSHVPEAQPDKRARPLGVIGLSSFKPAAPEQPKHVARRGRQRVHGKGIPVAEPRLAVASPIATGSRAPAQNCLLLILISPPRDPLLDHQTRGLLAIIRDRRRRGVKRLAVPRPSTGQRRRLPGSPRRPPARALGEEPKTSTSIATAATTATATAAIGPTVRLSAPNFPSRALYAARRASSRNNGPAESPRPPSAPAVRMRAGLGGPYSQR